MRAALPSLELQFILAASKTAPTEEDAQLLVRLGASPLRWDTIYALALHHQTASLIYNTIRNCPPLQKNCPAPLYEKLQLYYYAVLKKNALLWQEFISLHGSLTRASIPFIPLKGILFGETLYRNPALRPVVCDIDLLVRKQDRGGAIAALKEQGYSLDPRYDEHTNCFAVWLRKETMIELHWDFAPSWLSRIDMQKIWQRARPSHIRSLPLLQLSPEDALLIAPIQLRHDWPQWKLIKLIDIHEMLSQSDSPLDWEYLHRAAAQYHLQRIFCFALFLCMSYCATPLPLAIEQWVKEELRHMPGKNYFLSEAKRNIEGNAAFPAGAPWLARGLLLDTYGDMLKALGKVKAERFIRLAFQGTRPKGAQ